MYLKASHLGQVHYHDINLSLQRIGLSSNFTYKGANRTHLHFNGIL